MARNRVILIIDNDVMVYLFWNLYNIDLALFNKVIGDLTFQYSEIWIPKIAREEFCIKKEDKRRKKRLTKLKNLYQIIRNCPIVVSENEIKSYVSKKVHRGEAEAIIQALKAKSKADSNFKFSDIVIFSNDTGALENAQTKFLTVKNYKDYKLELRERGIVIPA